MVSLNGLAALLNSLVTALSQKADTTTINALSDVVSNKATSTAVNSALAAKADKATTLAGYGITDAYTKTETDAAMDSRIETVLGTAPANLDTLGELAEQLSNEENAVAAMNNLIAQKANTSDVNNALALKADKTTTDALTNVLAEKEASITQGTEEQYFRGDKAWRDFAMDVRGTILLGFSIANKSAVTAADSVLGAIGKLQAQINDLLTGGGAVSQAITSSIGAFSGNTTKHDANTTPLITDGTQIWSQVITPSALGTKITLKGTAYVDHSNNNRRVAFGIFRGSVCIGVASANVQQAGSGLTLPLSFKDQPNVLTPVTYSIRAWSGGGGTWYVNQASTPYFNGMLAKQTIEVQELV